MSALEIAVRSLRSYRRTLLVWVVAVGALGALQVLFWPAFRDQAEQLDQLVESLPAALRAFVGGRDLLTPEGFLNSRFSSIFPLLFAVYATFRMSSETAGEEQDGGFELILAAPVARWQLLLGKFGATVAVLVAVTTGLGLLAAVAAVTVDLGVPVVRILASTAAMALLGIAFAGVTLAVAGLTGRRGTSLGAGAGLAVAASVFYSFAPLVPALEDWRWLSPFTHAIGYDPLSNGLDLGRSLILVTIAVVGATVGAVAFERRDVGTAT